MGYFPLMVDVRRVPVWVIGGGVQAEPKLRALKRADAVVAVWAPALIPDVDALIRSTPDWTWHPAYPSPADLPASVIVFAVTDDPSLNRDLAGQAEARGALVNAVDDPAACDFIAASHFRRGPLIVAVSTSGAAPAVARALKNDLAEAIGPEWGAHIEAVADLRARLKAEGLPFADRRDAINEFVRRHRPRLGQHR